MTVHEPKRPGPTPRAVSPQERIHIQLASRDIEDLALLLEHFPNKSSRIRHAVAEYVRIRKEELRMLKDRLAN